jgi:hypothetical protein
VENIKEVKLGMRALKGENLLDFLVFASNHDGEPTKYNSLYDSRQMGLNCLLRKSPWVLEEVTDLCTLLDPGFPSSKSQQCQYRPLLS